MKVESFLETVGAEFFAGVPDSQLKALCDYLMNTYGINEQHHIIAPNEGNCVALAAGYHLATGRVPVVYMQNSGEGNAINPIASLLNEKVYGIPMIFVIGWRGEPGIHDEPQHIFQGEITLELLQIMGISYYVIDQKTTDTDVKEVMKAYRKQLESGKQVAFVVRKGALLYDGKVDYSNENSLKREEIIKHIVNISKADPIISTTGKASRELFEIREGNNQSHQFDFLTVGSMGHSSSIALGIAFQKKDKKVWCIDGDGAILMHMGTMALIGANAPRNLIHIVINNEAHETVGGMPTVMSHTDLVAIAKGCGYPYAVSVADMEALDRELLMAKERNELTFIEVKCAIGARKDLGRPTISAQENKKAFINYLNIENK